MYSWVPLPSSSDRHQFSLRIAGAANPTSGASSGSPFSATYVTHPDDLTAQSTGTSKAMPRWGLTTVFQPGTRGAVPSPDPPQG
ncbi:hypothetical protein [Streptomyces sp. SS07]|uniref:hypothetical protein n=1 Tax=Streptomyces sp. SS07 TaxID=2015315 RepID=UPI0015C5E028|nr:hypothetical protein [Streptomyces sp. SS07]